MARQDLLDLAGGRPPTVVVGMDGSANSLEALRCACRYAELLGARVLAAYAYHLPVEDSPQLLERVAGWVTAAFNGAPAPVPVQPVARHGSPREVLTSLAREAELLVVGANGQSAGWRLLLGSTAEACAYAAGCPVLVVPTQRGRVPARPEKAGVPALATR